MNKLKLLFSICVILETVLINWYKLPKYFNKKNIANISILQCDEFWQSNERSVCAEPNHNLYSLSPAINGYDALHIAATRYVMSHPKVENIYRRHIAATEPLGGGRHRNMFLTRQFWLCKQYVVGPLPDKHKLYPYQSTCFLEKLPKNNKYTFPIPEVQLKDIPASLSDFNDEDYLINNIVRDANKVSLIVGPLPDWRLLLVVDSNYPGWYAYVDGYKTDMIQANDAFKAIPIPPGIHTVQLIFSPSIVYISIAITLIGILLVLWTIMGNSKWKEI